MATLARLFDFMPGDIIRSADVDAEFNQLVNLVNGTTQDVQTILQLNDVVLATLILNQVTALNTAKILSLKANGVEKIYVDGTGRIRSTFSSPATASYPNASVAAPDVYAPIATASTGLCLNLNADMVDGLHASDLISVATGAFTSDITISNAGPKLTFDDTDVGDVGDCYWQLQTDGTNQQLGLYRKSDGQAVVRFNITQFTSQFHNIVSLRHTDSTDVDITVSVGGSVPDQHLTPKKYVDDRKTQWAIGTYYNGAPTTASKVGQFIFPDNVRDCWASKLKIVWQGIATLTGNTTVDVVKNGVSVGAVTLTNVTTQGTVVTNDIADVQFNAGDILTFEVLAVGGHVNISVVLSGWQKVSTN